MQTIDEYRAYARQLENDVGKWHRAYDALIVERNALVRRLLNYESRVIVKCEEGHDVVAIARETFDAMSTELEEKKNND